MHCKWEKGKIWKFISLEKADLGKKIVEQKAVRLGLYTAFSVELKMRWFISE